MKRALIVVDVQNDFCEGGSLAVTGGADVAKRISDELLDPSAYDVFAFTKDWHVAPGDHWSDEPDYVDSWPVHCEAMTKGADFHNNLLDGFGQVRLLLGPNRTQIFFKGEYEAAYSGFEGYDVREQTLIEYLTKHDIDQVDVVGIALDYCVQATARDAASFGFITRVLGRYTVPVSADNMPAVLANFANDGIEYIN